MKFLILLHTSLLGLFVIDVYENISISGSRVIRLVLEKHQKVFHIHICEMDHHFLIDVSTVCCCC